MIGITGVELCEHGLRYCVPCGTANPPCEPQSEDVWLKASRKLRGWQSKAKKEKPEAE